MPKSVMGLKIIIMEEAKGVGLSACFRTKQKELRFSASPRLGRGLRLDGQSSWSEGLGIGWSSVRACAAPGVHIKLDFAAELGWLCKEFKEMGEESRASTLFSLISFFWVERYSNIQMKGWKGSPLLRIRSKASLHGTKLVFNGKNNGIQDPHCVFFDGVVYLGVDVEERRESKRCRCYVTKYGSASEQNKLFVTPKNGYVTPKILVII
ncbi:hypothetical protein M5K25_010992 [Dendrobium thyrsiflorum]|uniref:Uncharacterized protein n=1 Tax=Dendrobium thyrsiflorum TaxID=117978 RepID=A0ABD0V8K1_DENTH